MAAIHKQKFPPEILKSLAPSRVGPLPFKISLSAAQRSNLSLYQMIPRTSLPGNQ